VHGSNILNNSGYNFLVSNEDDNSTTVDVANNWWGTTDSATIAGSIFDYYDYGFGPKVGFVPFAAEPFDIDDTTAVDVNDPDFPSLPTSFALSQNYPNPFNSGTVIAFSLTRSTIVKLTVFNVLGQPVRTVAAGRYPAGEHSVAFDGLDDHDLPLASGVYFYRLTAGDLSQSRKMVILK